MPGIRSTARCARRARRSGWVEPSETDYVKRVIGVGGDRVVCCDKRGRIEVNGRPVDEDYLYPGDARPTVPFDIVVPEGTAVGDGRPPLRLQRLPGPPRLAGRGHGPVDRVIGRAGLDRLAAATAGTRLDATRRVRRVCRARGRRPWVTAGDRVREPTDRRRPRRCRTGTRPTAAGAAARPGRAERRRRQRKVKRRRRRSAVQGDTDPHRCRAAHRPGPEDLPRAGVRDPVRLDGADDPDRRPCAGRQAHPLVRLEAAARRRRRLQGPGRLARATSRRSKDATRRDQAGQAGPDLHRAAALGRRAGPDQARRRRSAATRSSAATRRAG